MTERQPPLPAFVTFETGARLLIDLDIDSEATATAIRYVARTSNDWPFGDGRPHPYIKVSNARAMETEAFLDYFRKHPRSGRGPDRQPRKRRGESR
jgi:hypothetical protein